MDVKIPDEIEVENEVECEVEFARKGTESHWAALYEKLWTLNFEL